MQNQNNLACLCFPSFDASDNENFSVISTRDLTFSYLLSKLSASLSEIGSERMLTWAGAFLETIGKSTAILLLRLLFI